jgi:phospholipid-binding lipoprotein MlaA
MIKPIFIKSLILVGLLFWAFSSEATTIAYYASNGTQISKAEYEVLDAKKSEDIIDLKYILDGDSPKNLDTEHQVAAADAKASNKDEAGEDLEDDEEYEEEDEYDDEVVQINDPLYGINYAFFKLNDILYVVIMKPAAQTYNFFIPLEFRTVISNFFYNLRFPIRFVNSLLQFKGTKAVHELGGFLLNSTVGLAGLGEVASHWDLKPSPEDLGQTLAVWGAGNGFYIMYPILGPSSLRDSARFVDSYFLDPVSWLRYSKFGGYSWRTTIGITAYDKFNELSLNYEDIDALMAAALDPYVAVRDAYIAHRNKLIAE